jgi:hypothetical protein
MGIRNSKKIKKQWRAIRRTFRNQLELEVESKETAFALNLLALSIPWLLSHCISVQQIPIPHFLVSGIALEEEVTMVLLFIDLLSFSQTTILLVDERNVKK